MKRNSDALKWGYLGYLPHNLKDRSKEEIRGEYKRLRDVFRKRMERISKSEFADSAIYKKNVKKFPGIGKIKSESDLKKKLTDLAYFVSQDISSLTGLRQQRENAIESINRIYGNESGKSVITQENFSQFTDFMDTLRDENIANIYDSERVLQLMYIQEKADIDLNILKKYFTQFIENDEILSAKLKDLKPPKNVKNTDRWWRKKLGIKGRT